MGASVNNRHHTCQVERRKAGSGVGKGTIVGSGGCLSGIKDDTPFAGQQLTGFITNVIDNEIFTLRNRLLLVIVCLAVNSKIQPVHVQSLPVIVT